MDGPTITFDKTGALRVLEEDKFEEANKLKESCTEFLEKTEKFHNILNSFMVTMENKAKMIEKEKLRAIGLRNQVESEKDVRKRKQRELEILIAEKEAEMDRYQKQLESLQRVEAEQKTLLEKLLNNEM